MTKMVLNLLTVNLPKLGFIFPARILSAVDFPIPFVPTKPKTCPGLGTGSLQKIMKGQGRRSERDGGIIYPINSGINIFYK